MTPIRAPTPPAQKRTVAIVWWADSVAEAERLTHHAKTEAFFFDCPIKIYINPGTYHTTVFPETD